MNIISRKVEELLHKYGDFYFQDFNEKEFTKALLSGDLTVRTLKLRPEAFADNKIPFSLVCGQLDEVVLVIPWANIFNEAVIIKVNGVYIHLQSKSVDEIVLTKEEEFQSILKEVITVAKNEFLTQMGSQGSILDFWMVKNLIDRIIDNVQIQIRNVHIEVEHMQVKPPFNIDMVIKDLELYTTDQSFMNKQFVKTAKSYDETGTKKQIFKVLSMTNLLVNIKPVEDQQQRKRGKAYEDHLKYNVFRISFNARLIKNSEHIDTDPDYEASLKFNQNEITVTHWQIQRILNLLDYIKKLSKRFDDLRASFEYHPERRIGEFFRVDPGSNPEIVMKYNRLKQIAVTNWWKYIILENVKAISKTRKKEVKGKFYGLVASMNIDKLLDYDTPGVMTDVYTDDLNQYFEDIAKKDFDTDKFVQDELRMHSLRSLMFIFPLRVQKVLARKFGRDYAAKVRERQKHTWLNFALSFIPYFGEPGLSSDQKEFKDLLQGELGRDKKKFSKFILKLSLEIKKGAYSLLSDQDPDMASRFGFYANSFSIDLKLYHGKMEASVDLKDFTFLFSKLDLKKNRTDFPVIKSTTTPGTSFLSAKFLSIKLPAKTSTSIDVYIQHVDVIFVNSVIADLISFFKVQEYDSEVASQALEGAGKFGSQGANNARRAINSSNVEIALMVNILSPRFLIPMTKKLDDLNNETNLFVFYLGDMIFVHNFRSGAVNSLGTVFNVKLNHVKLEFWEDYERATKQLNIVAKNEFEDDSVIDYVTNFVMLDLVAVIKYTGSSDGKAHNVSVLFENLDVRINPYTFHQLRTVQSLVDFSKELNPDLERRIMMRTKNSEMAILEKTLPCKKKLEDKYEVRHIIITKNIIFIYTSVEAFDPEASYYLAGYSVFVAEDTKTHGYILKLWKDKVVLSIAFRTFDECKYWVNRLIEVSPELTVRSIKERDKEELPFVFNLDLIVKKVEVWLFNEIFERNTLFAVKYLEVRVAMDKMLKAKVSLDSLMVENFEKSFAIRGIKTILWIGSTQWPSHHERKLYRHKDDIRTQATMNRTSQVGSIPGPPSQDMAPEELDLSASINGELDNVSAIGVAKLRAGKGFGVEAAKRAIGDKSADKMNGGKNSNVSNRVDKNIAEWSQRGTLRDGNKDEFGRIDPNMQNDGFDDTFERRNKKEMANLRRIDEGFIVYFEQTRKVIDIDLHIVNVTTTYDTDYIQSIEKKVNDFIKFDPKKDQEATDGASQATAKQPKKKRKVDPATVADDLKMRAQVKIDRVCVVLRTKNQNVFDTVIIDMKVVFTQFVKRMLVNVYMKRLALRDLTGYPFTKKPEQLKDYRRQTKNLIVSFIETSKEANLDNLDNNGVIVIAEVVGEDFVPDNKIATKAEVILNNGEANFFMQPVLRLVDFLLVQLLGYLLPDNSIKMSVEDMKKQALNIKKMSLNIFMRNTRVNLIPNFYVDKCLILELPIVAVLNEQYEDPTRIKEGVGELELPVYSETMTIEVRGGVLKGLLRGFNALELKTVTVSIDRLLNGGNFDRLFGRMESEKMLEKRNKIIIAIEEADVNFRRDEFYALLTWILNSPSYNDQMDEFLLDIRILLQPISASLSDDGGNEFFSFNFDIFYIDIKMTSDRRQVINIFGKGLDGDVVTSNGMHGETRPIYPFLKELQKMDVFGSGEYGPTTSYERRNKKKSDKKYENMTLRKDVAGLKSIAEKLHETVRILETESEANFFIDIIQKTSGEGQFINLTVRKFGVNALIPVIMAILKITAMTDEMSMNSLIRPKLKQNIGIFNMTVNIEDVFVFLVSPRGKDLSIVLHVQEVSFFTGTEPKDKAVMINNELVNYFDPKEYSGDELFQQLNDYNPEKIIPVSQMSAALNNAYMDFVPSSRLMDYIRARVARDSTLGISRNIMQPTFVAYQTRQYKFRDNYNEMNFNRGVAHVGAISLLVNTEFVDYILGWLQESELKQIAHMQFKGIYEAHIKTILQHSLTENKPTINKVNKSSLDVIVQGVTVTMLDDIFNTNLPMVHLTVMPINVGLLQNSDYSGFKDLNLTLEASVFNYNSQEWEPIMENFTLIVESFIDATEEKVSRTNVSFSDRNPALNVSTELAVIGLSIFTKITQKPDRRQAAAFRRAIQQVAMKAMTTRSAPMSYEALAVLDKEKMLNYVNNFKNSPYGRSSVSPSLDNTKLYGYDDMVRSNYPINNILMNKMNFAEKAAVMPKNPLNYRANDNMPQGGHIGLRQSEVFDSVANSGILSGPTQSIRQSQMGYPSLIADPQQVNRSFMNSSMQESLLYQGYQSPQQQQMYPQQLMLQQQNPYQQQQMNTQQQFAQGGIPMQFMPPQKYGQQQQMYSSGTGSSLMPSSMLSMQNSQMQQQQAQMQYQQMYQSQQLQMYQSQTRQGNNRSSIVGIEQTTGPENLSPDKVKELRLDADKRADTEFDEIYLREIPYRVENFTGRDIIFSLTFCDLPKQIFVRNLENRDLEYPFTLENTLIQRKLLKNRFRHVQYRVYEVDERNATFLVHQGSDLYSLKKTRVPLGSLGSGPESALRYMIVEVNPMIMKKNILFKSPILVINKCRHHVQVHFSRGEKRIYTMQVVEDNILPVPVDLLDCFVDFDVSNVAKKAEVRVPAMNLWAAPTETVQAYSSNEIFSLSLFTDSDEDCRYLYITPPLVVKNMFLQNLSLQVYRLAMGREYSDTYELTVDQDSIEIYNIASVELTKIRFRVEANTFVSETIVIDLGDARLQELTGNFWMYFEGQKKFTLNYNIFFLKGSFVLTIFVQHVVFDDLFRRVVYSQRGDRFEDNLTPINLLNENTLLNKYKSAIWASPASNTSTLMEGGERELHRSTIFMLPFPKGDLWLSDQKDKYELVSINTDKAGEKNYRIRAINPITNAIEIYEIIVSNTLYKISNQPELVMNITHVRHRYLISNLTNLEIQIIQLNQQNSVEKMVKPGQIKPVHFSPDDKDKKERRINIGVPGYEWSDLIEIDKPTLYYFMIKNVFDQTPNVVEGISIERFVTLSIQITYLWNATHLLTVRREPEQGAFKIMNNLDEVILFFSQDPFKLQNNVAEVALRPNTFAYYSWPSTFSKKRDLYMIAFNTTNAIRSELYRIEYDQTARAYDLFGNRIFHTAIFSGASLHLSFSNILDQQEKRKLVATVTAAIPYLGISIIAGRNQNRRELMYISIIELSYNQMVYDRISKLFLKLRFLNIDNSSEYLAYYPILFTPKFSYDNIRENDWNHLDLYIKQVNPDRKNLFPSTMTVLNKVDLKLLGNILMIEESWIHYVLNAVDDVQRQLLTLDKILNKRQTRTITVNPDLNKNFKADLIRSADLNFWNLTTKETQSSALYINELAINEHQVSVSLRRERKDDPRAALNRYSNYLQSLGFKYVPSFEDIELGFKPFFLGNGLYSTEAITKALTHQYRNNAIRTGIPSILKLNSLIGKPKILSKGASSAMRSTLVKPPRNYGDTVSGVSLSRINRSGFNSIAPSYNQSGVSQHSMQASRLMTQMNLGMSQMGSSKFGAQEALERPFEIEGREYDAEPTFLGSVRQSFAGFASTVARPFKNLFTTTNSARKRIEREKEEGTYIGPSLERLRTPRAFYGETSFIKKYNENDADVAKEIEEKSNNHYDKLINYAQVYNNNPNTFQLLINTVAYIYCMDPHDKLIAWSADKTQPVTVNQAGNNGLSLEFRDAVSVVFR